MAVSIWALEPRLIVLLAEAREHQGGEGFCANDIWYGHARHPGLKEQLVKLVGWGRAGWEQRNDSVLNRSEAYDEAYKAIYGALPDCQHGERTNCF